MNKVNTELLKGVPENLRSKLNLLTEKELKYFLIMWSRYGVLFITDKPGVGKSAIFNSIAKKIDAQYIDVRLASVDEVDIGSYPVLKFNEQYNVNSVDFAVPNWAIESNSKLTIIHFEELNRASLQVRNAALQILLERQIGSSFKFNDNVLMVSSGNLGDEDSTDVEELDSALNNRLVHIKHNLTPQEWIDGFAKDNVHPCITSYINANPEQMYVKPAEGQSAYATPRSWTMLSEYIVRNFGMDANISDFLPSLRLVASGYVGVSSIKFIQFLETSMKVTIQDILNRYDDVKSLLDTFQRDFKSGLLHSLTEIDFVKLSKSQLNNAASFLKSVQIDERTGFLSSLIDNPNKKDLLTTPSIREFFKLNFQDELIKIKAINNAQKG